MENGGSDTYARSYGGRVARLQATFANAARGADHYENFDEREIASGLKDWLVEPAGRGPWQHQEKLLRPCR